MTASTSPSDLRESVDRQAKRLRDHFNLKLSRAQKILAVALYGCAGWADLIGRLNGKHMSEHILMLASLPKSDDAKAYFNAHLERLSRSFSQHMLTNTNLVGLYGALRHVFAVSDKSADLSDVVPSIPILAWQSMGIGPDSDAVIRTTISVNGVSIQLIGTRVYMPRHYDFGEEVTCPAHLAEPIGTFKTIWSDFDSWWEAAFRYLSLLGDGDDDDDDESIELLLPEQVLDDAMSRHQEWLSRIAKCWPIKFSYGGDGDGDDEGFLPFVFPEKGCYLIFGVPMATPSGLNEAVDVSLALRGDADNDSLLVLIDGQPLCVEWVSINPLSGTHDGRRPDYFDRLVGGIFSHSDCDLDIYRSGGRRDSYLFVRPAAQSDIDRRVRIEVEHEPGKEVLVIQSDYPELASVVFDKVASRDVTIHSSRFEELVYLIELDVTQFEEVRRLSLALKLKGEVFWGVRNLATRCRFRPEGKQKKLYIQVAPQLLSLVDEISKKDLKDAVQCGYVLHRPAGLGYRLEQAPKRCRGLLTTPQELMDWFDRSPFSDNFSTFDLFANTSTVKYARDNL